MYGFITKCTLFEREFGLYFSTFMNNTIYVIDITWLRQKHVPSSIEIQNERIIIKIKYK